MKIPRWNQTGSSFRREDDITRKITFLKAALIIAGILLIILSAHLADIIRLSREKDQDESSKPEMISTEYNVQDSTLSPEEEYSEFIKETYSLETVDIRETDPDDFESQDDPEDGISRCKNCNILEVSLPDGDTLRVGATCSDSDNLYLSPVASGNSSSRYAFKVQDAMSANETLLFSGTTGSIRSFSSAQKNFILQGDTFDTLSPTDGYVSEEDFGVCFHHSYILDGCLKEAAERTLYLRVYDADCHALLSSYALSITYDTSCDALILSAITDNDVRVTNVLPEGDMEKMVNEVYQELLDQNLRSPVLQTEINQEILTEWKDKAVVEYVDSPFYPKVHSLDDASRVFIAQKYGHIDIYACTMQYSQKESLTFYFSPHNQLLGVGFDSTSVPGSDDLDLQMWGYGLVQPDDLNTMLQINYQLFYQYDGTWKLDQSYRDYLDSIGETWYLRYQNFTFH